MAISVDENVERSFLIRGHDEDAKYGDRVRWILTARHGSRGEDNSHVHFCGLVVTHGETFTLKDKTDIKAWAKDSLNAKSCSFERATTMGWRKSYFTDNGAEQC